MLNNMNFYSFMHRQILIVIALFVSTGFGYVYMGWFYSSLRYELLWFFLLLLLSLWGYRLYKIYKNNNLNMQEKEKWLNHLRYFLFIYFSMWTIMFFLYILHPAIELHYIAIATQLGVAVVSATILVSQRKLAIATLISLMLPLVIYFILLDEFYSYLLSFFTIVLGGVLLYASSNTFNYLVKSQYQAYHDYLTSLGNRRYLIELLENSIRLQKQNKKFPYLLLIDLDHFKTINDTLGHDIGDELLCEVANRMKELSKRHYNHVSRLGGDEFCILSSPYDTKEESLEHAMRFAQELLRIIKKSYTIKEHHLYISASVGISIINSPDMQAGTFIKEADIAMYEAKTQGRDGIILFNDDLSKKVEYKLEIERLLHFALEHNEISLKYQTQVNEKNEIIGCEVLARWHNEKLGNVPPDEFIGIAEQTGLIIELGYYILKEAFQTLKSWDEKGIYLQQMSINISMRQMFHSSFINDVRKLSAQYLNDNLTSKIVFEITETSVAEDVELLIRNMNMLKTLGIRFSMDDFGTGYSSLSYLRKLPINELKIDKSFIFELENSEQGKTMIKTIVNIAKNLNLNIVSEGVEKSSQQKFLIEERCDILQGFYFSHPMDKEAFEKLLLH
ncbi:bifunctional diguanylate cyclase/phosphodiesterase [bacterium]|nr:bifunctional diguanylate cyclase/phosphodiesterase [bacterium]MBU1991276.1 bifunctional diguanylate cyclase/phosphodiesterase [bacterium]